MIRQLKPYNLLLAAMIVFFVPAFIPRMLPIPHFNLIRIVAFALFDIVSFLCLYADARHSRLPDAAFPFTIVFFYTYSLLVTAIIEPNSMHDCIVRTFLACSSAVFLDYLFSKHNPERVINVLMLSFEILLYCNLIAMLRYPNGMLRVQTTGVEEMLVAVEDGYNREYGRVLWLLGHQTNLIRFTLSATCVALINLQYQRLRGSAGVRSYLLIITCLIETFIAKSAMNYIVLIVFVLLLALYVYRRGMSLWKMMLIVALCYIGLLLATDINLDNDLFTRILGRNVTLSTRVPIWRKTVTCWRESMSTFLFGRGYIDEDSFAIRSMLGLGNPHSTYLWVLFEGGVFGLVAFLTFSLLSMKGLRFCKSCFVTNVISAAFVALLISMITDDHLFRSQIALILFYLAYHSKSITDELDELRRSR